MRTTRLRLCVPVALLVCGISAPLRAEGQVTRLRVAAYNIKHGRGMDDQVDLARIAAVLERLDADVITLQEVDDRTERTGRVDQVRVLAEMIGYEGFHGPHRPYQGGFYGNAVLTRLPVRAQRTHAIPPASGSALAVHEVVVDVPPSSADGDPIRVSVVSVHLAGSPDERMAQAESVTRTFEGADHPVVLAGDFNGRPDDTVVRRLAKAWTVGAKEGDSGTYPAPRPDREIDFVMWREAASGRAGATLTLIEHVVLDEPLASDHRPLLAVFEVGRDPTRERSPLVEGNR
jgi:endonuclease/exonuclease/phosphatase family metal-dependent hydrolase